MAGRGAPSFLKRQKELKRAARALAKRQAKQARRENRGLESTPDEGLDPTDEMQPAEQDPGTDESPRDPE